MFSIGRVRLGEGGVGGWGGGGGGGGGGGEDVRFERFWCYVCADVNIHCE